MGRFGSHQWIANRKNKCLARRCSWFIWQDWRNEQSTGYRSAANGFGDIRQLYRAHEVNEIFLHAVLIHNIINKTIGIDYSIIICNETDSWHVRALTPTSPAHGRQVLLHCCLESSNVGQWQMYYLGSPRLMHRYEIFKILYEIDTSVIVSCIFNAHTHSIISL